MESPYCLRCQGSKLIHGEICSGCGGTGYYQEDMPPFDEHRRLRSPWRILCRKHGPVCLTTREYRAQLDRRDDTWICPLCRRPALYDSDWLDAFEVHHVNDGEVEVIWSKEVVRLAEELCDECGSGLEREKVITVALSGWACECRFKEVSG